MRHLWLSSVIFPVVLTLEVIHSDSALGQESQASWSEQDLSGLEFRSLGPAFMSGRIADIAIHPDDDNVWYIAVGSGGVWKTLNAGVTWNPIFDDQSSYSIGCVTIDPSHPETIWVGTGENVGGRHVGFGDGVYRSRDGGKTWKNMGLQHSEHLSKILVHPSDSNRIWVAAQGPLWKRGGQRGLYLSRDGGETWTRTLGDDDWVGVTDLCLDPRKSKILYAATWQRHRTVAAYMGGGPGSGLHRSLDGGKTWEALTHGLPKSNMGKIGLAISPQNPDVLYAAIELDRRTGALYRSSDRGMSWEKMSDTVSGGTGPHYYQELYASPHTFDRLYLADVRIQVSDDGGKTFRRLREKHKHSDNHAMAFRADDPDYLLVGTDGGLYESFDLAANWRFLDNLPVTQFYKIAVDDTEPFYNIYGGTQDNATQSGPSRTDNVHGIQNSDWRVVLDWDGHQPATEPGNPNIVYAERQEGFLSRIDMSTGEIIDIQPQPEKGESYERFNWDAPILVSPHLPTRLYFASQRVWRSDNRGDTWTAISGDLTRNQDRIALPIMGETQSWDNPWDVSAMSNYNTITSLSESTKKEGLIYAGTDDGLIHVFEGEGNSWRSLEASTLPGVPATAFVNDIKADQFDPDKVYVALDNHKYGDFTPYLFRSEDRGRTWQSMRGNLPDRTLVWRLVQDHIAPDLFFCATEFGIYVSTDAGRAWIKLGGGIPTISFRDLAIHRRESDLIAASFGRGIFVYDDISVFRELAETPTDAEGTLFSVRKTPWYFPRPQLGFEGSRGDQGASHFVAPNPDFGALFTYHLKEGYPSQKEQREQAESSRSKSGQELSFPGWENVEKERREARTKVWLVVSDSTGQVVRRIEGPNTKGFHRVAWDLRHPRAEAIELVEPPPPMWGGPPKGLMAAPGEYTVTLCVDKAGEIRSLSKAQAFAVVPIRKGALSGASQIEVAQFWRAYEVAVRAHSQLKLALSGGLNKLERLQKIIEQSQTSPGDVDQRWHELRSRCQDLDSQLNGDRSRQEPGEKNDPIIEDRLFAVSRGVDHSTFGPTMTHRRSLEIANEEIQELQPRIRQALKKIETLVQDLVGAGAPWLEGSHTSPRRGG